MLQTDAKDFTPEERAQNEATCAHLVRGATYRFDPPISATAVSVSVPAAHPPVEAQFVDGWYIGYVHGVHVFQGKPANDQRKLADNCRESYFHVAFVGGQSVPTLVNLGPTG